MSCDRGLDAGAYVLRALTDEESASFALHLDSCHECRLEIEQLQMVVDTLPIAAPQFAPPAALKDRIMREVRAEAELLQAAGPDADRVPERSRPRWRELITLRPGVAAALACALLALGVGAGILTQTGSNSPATHHLSAQVTASGASASLAVTGEHAALDVSGMPSPPAGKVYQVWFQDKNGTVRPTHTLFNVRDDGHAEVPIEESVKGVKKIMVTAEQSGGATAPTSAPVITAVPA